MELTRETLSNFYYIIRLSWSHYDIKFKYDIVHSLVLPQSLILFQLANLGVLTFDAVVSHVTDFLENRAIFSELSNGCVTIGAFDALCLAFRCLPSYDRSVVLNSAKQHYLVKRKKTRWARLIHYELHLSGDHVFHLGAFIYFQYTTVPFFRRWWGKWQFLHGALASVVNVKSLFAVHIGVGVPVTYGWFVFHSRVYPVVD